MLRLINLPWSITRPELTRFLSRTLDTRVRYAKILYNKDTGLSRGIAIVQIDNEQITKDITRRGTLSIEGRTVIVARENKQRSAQLVDS